MILVILFLLLAVVAFGFLIYNNVEKYRLLYDINPEKIEKGSISTKVKKRLTGGAKYGHGSDYDKMHQKRAKGSIRDTGEDR